MTPSISNKLSIFIVIFSCLIASAVGQCDPEKGPYFPWIGNPKSNPCKPLVIQTTTEEPTLGPGECDPDKGPYIPWVGNPKANPCALLADYTIKTTTEEPIEDSDAIAALQSDTEALEGKLIGITQQLELLIKANDELDHRLEIQELKFIEIFDDIKGGYGSHGSLPTNPVYVLMGLAIICVYFAY